MRINKEQEARLKILILAPHPDDGELGCGASISKYLEEGHEIYYMTFSFCEESIREEFPQNILETEVKKATQGLGISNTHLIIKRYPVRKFPQHRQDILEDLILIQKNISPDLVFMPSSFDIHQDHNTIFLEGRRAFRNSSLLGYEFIWDNFSFNTSCFISVNEKHIQKKIEAVNVYRSQHHRFYAKKDLIRGLASYRGLQVSTEFAEAFEVIRWIIK